jgi:hypothetical protein
MQLLELFFPIHPLNVAPINRESVNNGEETKGPMVECHFVTLSYVSRQKTFPVKVEMYKSLDQRLVMKRLILLQSPIEAMV